MLFFQINNFCYVHFCKLIFTDNKLTMFVVCKEKKFFFEKDVHVGQEWIFLFIFLLFFVSLIILHIYLFILCHLFI